MSRQYRQGNVLHIFNNNNWFSSDFDRPHTVNASINFEGDAFNSFSFNFTGQTGRPYTVANGVYKQENVTIPIFLSRNNDQNTSKSSTPFVRVLSWKYSN